MCSYMNKSLFFTPATLGPVILRNRSIRAAAFEGMSQCHLVSDHLIQYHTALAKGGVGMTTVAYASVNKSGLSFPHQLYMHREAVPGLQKLTASVKKHGAAVSIQLGHCGNMANRSVTGLQPIAPTGGINWYGPTFPRSMSAKDIEQVITDFKYATQLADEAGFDAIEIHAGHGYLISQFLSPYTNKRKDDYSGSFENRSRFMREVLIAVKSVMPKHMALIVKMNSSDGFSGGITLDESLQTAKMIETCGADAIVVSGGFVSRAPMYVMRGAMPVDIMAHFIPDPVKKFFVKMFGKQLIPALPFKEGYFMDDAWNIQQQVNIPVVLVGGMNSMQSIDSAIQKGFQFIAMARALIQNTNFINELRDEVIDKSACTICNYCVAKMYSGEMTCFMHEPDLPATWVRKLSEPAYES